MLANFHGPARSIYFLDVAGYPKVGFVGIQHFSQDDEAQIWKTIDGGLTWRKICVISHGGGVVQFTFKDSLTGWCALQVGNADEGCYKTTDGGETWNKVFWKPQPTAVYYHPFTKLLFFATPWNGSYASTDFGSTWNQILPGCIGLTFNDDLHGFWTGNLVGDGYVTSDGGLTWQKSGYVNVVWQPYAVPKTSVTYGCSKNTGIVSRSTDYGMNWNVISVLSRPGIYASMGAVGSCLLTRTEEGFVASSDDGINWHYVGGPAWVNPTWTNPFYSQGTSLYAPSGYALWLNENSGLPVPHLPIEVQGAKHVTPDKSVTAKIWKGETDVGLIDWPRGIDFDVTFNTNVLSFEGDSTNEDYTVLSRTEQSPGSIHYTLKWNGLLKDFDSLVLSLKFIPLVSLESSSKISVTNVTYKDHENWIACMPTPPANGGEESVEVSVTGCGIETLRQFMRDGHLPLDFISVTPSPASRELHVKLKKLLNGNVRYEIVSSLGEKIKSGVFTEAETQFDISDLSAGSYILRLSQAGAVISRKILIER